MIGFVPRTRPMAARMPRFMPLLGLLVPLVLLGCAATRDGAEAPRRVLTEYAHALRAGELRQAYAMMTPEYQRRHSFEAFAQRIRARPRQVKRTVAQLTAGDGQIEVTARAKIDAADSLKLVYREGRWWIAHNPLDLYRQDSPRQALRSFVRALEHRRYDIVLRLAPSKWASVLTVEKVRRSWEGPKRAEMEQLVLVLKQHLDLPIRYEGEARAVMPYDERHAVRFVREDGLWKIEDPD